MNRPHSATVSLPSDTEILITRQFEAPAPLVFTVWTTPEYVCRWWGSPESPLVVCDIDLAVGGRWRYVAEYPDGRRLGWRGTYREIVVPSRLVSTEVFEGYPNGEAVNTLTLTEHDGLTTMSVVVVHTSRENRDGHIDSGMEGGMQITLDRIDEILHEFA